MEYCTLESGSQTGSKCSSKSLTSERLIVDIVTTLFFSPNRTQDSDGSEVVAGQWGRVYQRGRSKWRRWGGGHVKIGDLGGIPPQKGFEKRMLIFAKSGGRGD